MLICDTHADTLYAMQKPERDKALALDVTLAHLSSPNDVRVQALALFVGTSGSMEEAAVLVERELAMLQQLKSEGFRQIVTLSEALPGKANVLLTIEGGEAFGADASSVERFAALGVRAAALVWNHENLLAHPAVGSNPNGLTAFGREICRRLNSRHIAIDISHLNERGVLDVLESGVPPMASHSCARALCRHARNLSDRQLHALFQAGGYVGVNFYASFLSDSGHANIDTVVDHIAYICDLGGEAHVGLGSDFDGIDAYPDGLRNAGDLPLLFERMRARGFDEALVHAVAGENFQHYLQQLSPSPC
ncbi:MAG: membrane dipeptidase [Clostridia bacterium]